MAIGCLDEVVADGVSLGRMGELHVNGRVVVMPDDELESVRQVFGERLRAGNGFWFTCIGSHGGDVSTWVGVNAQVEVYFDGEAPADSSTTLGSSEVDVAIRRLREG